MALIICPECEKKISEFAPACPGCGCPMPKIEEIILERLIAKEEAEESARKEQEQKKEEERLLEAHKKKQQELRIEQQKKLEEEKNRLKAEKELEEYKKYIASLRVEEFDVITLQKVNDSSVVKTFKVNSNWQLSDKVYLGRKCFEIFTDVWGVKWKVLDIEKNNPLKELAGSLPGWAVSGMSLSGVSTTPTKSQKVYED